MSNVIEASTMYNTLLDIAKDFAEQGIEDPQPEDIAAEAGYILDASWQGSDATAYTVQLAEKALKAVAK